MQKCLTAVFLIPSGLKWTSLKAGSDLCHPVQVKHSVDFLNKTPKIPTNIPSSQLPDKFNNFFIDKIDVIRDELDLISEHPIFKKYDGVCFSIFTLVDEKYVTSIIMKSKKCFCELDPLPGKLFYECLDIIIPFITTIFNESLSNGVFPTDIKESIVIPH